ASPACGVFAGSCSAAASGRGGSCRRAPCGSTCSTASSGATVAAKASATPTSPRSNASCRRGKCPAPTRKSDLPPSQPPAQLPGQAVEHALPPALAKIFAADDAFAVADLVAHDLVHNPGQVAGADHGQELQVDPQTAGVEVGRADHRPLVIDDQ